MVTGLGPDIFSNELAWTCVLDGCNVPESHQRARAE